jgi:hypothetical protein
MSQDQDMKRSALATGPRTVDSGSAFTLVDGELCLDR